MQSERSELEGHVVGVPASRAKGWRDTSSGVGSCHGQCPEVPVPSWLKGQGVPSKQDKECTTFLHKKALLFLCTKGTEQAK
eukprot:1156477-Pelagomonas_calceolata.AAC.6